MLSRNGVGYTYDATRIDAVSAFGSVTYSYDANGNRSTRTEGTDTWEYLHDGENRLVEVKRNGSLVARYVYNGDGQRVLAVAGDEKTVYIGDYFEARMDGSIPAPVYTPEGDYNLYFPLVTGGAMPQTGRMVEPPPHTEWRTYYTLGGMRVGLRVQGGSRVAGGVRYDLLSDHLGSVTAAVNRWNAVTGSVRYGAWGEERVSTGTLPTDRGYTGQLEADEVGLYFYNARWYDAYLNRWIQPDTIIPDPYNTLDYDRYSYVRNNPINATDSSGHCIDGISTYFCIVAAGAVVGAVVSYSTQVVVNIAEDGFSGEAFLNVDGASIAAAAVAGAVGAGVGIVGAAIAGTGLVATVATGAVGGMISGQASRATTNILTGQDIGSGLGNPTDMLLDGTIGGVTAGVGFGITRILQSSFYYGDFPENSSTRFLLRRSGDGRNGAGFAEYDLSTTRARYRVDLEGTAHGGIETPHLHEARWNTPPGGEPIFNGWGETPGVNVFSYNRAKASIIRMYMNFTE